MELPLAGDADGIAGFVDRLEITAIETEMQRVFARRDRVGLRARGDENRSCRQLRVARLVPDSVARLGARTQQRLCWGG